jgi:uncharacterized protein
VTAPTSSTGGILPRRYDDLPLNLDSVTLVLLRRGPRATEFTEAELDALQERHLAYLDEMRRRGHMAAAGPFSDQPDESLRGICLYVTDLEETRRLAEGDPSVRAGRLTVDVMRWSFLRREVVFPRRGDPVILDMAELFVAPTPGPGNSDGGDVELP